MKNLVYKRFKFIFQRLLHVCLAIHTPHPQPEGTRYSAYSATPHNATGEQFRPT